MEAVSTSETSVYFTRLYGILSQKNVIFTGFVPRISFVEGLSGGHNVYTISHVSCGIA
jgi:hypothetical protein